MKFTAVTKCPKCGNRAAVHLNLRACQFTGPYNRGVNAEPVVWLCRGDHSESEHGQTWIGGGCGTQFVVDVPGQLVAPRVRAIAKEKA